MTLDEVFTAWMQIAEVQQAVKVVDERIAKLNGAVDVGIYANFGPIPIPDEPRIDLINEALMAVAYQKEGLSSGRARIVKDLMFVNRMVTALNEWWKGVALPHAEKSTQWALEAIFAARLGNRWASMLSTATSASEAIEVRLKGLDSIAIDLAVVKKEWNS